MATGHSILDTLNATSKGGQPIGPSGKFRTKDLPISQLYRNEGNFYGIVEIEELAGKILMAGLMENLAVVYDPCPAGQYRIVSGERRWEALKLLVSRGHNEFAVATCNVRTKRSQEEETIDLILANAQRVKSVEDQLQEYSTLKATLERMRANGQQLEGYDLESGRLRDVIAAILNKSTTKIAQLERINGHLIPELRALLDTGALKFSAAYNLAGMDEQAQQDAFRRAQDEGREITHQEAKQARTAAQAAAESNPWASGRCEMVNGACDHYPVIKANFLHNGQIENCAGCCQMCNRHDVCDFCCGIVAAQRPVPAVPVDTTEAHEKTDAQKEEREHEEKRPAKTTEAAREEPTRGVPKYKQAMNEAICTESDDDLFEMLQYAVEVSGLPENQLIACMGLIQRMQRRISEDVTLVAALLSAFGCVGEDGIVNDCVGYGGSYTPGEIMDVILDTVDKITGEGAGSGYKVIGVDLANGPDFTPEVRK